MSLSCEMALQAKANSSASLDFLAQVKLICGYHSKLLNPLKTNMAKRWKITIFNRRNIFIHGGFSTFMLSLRVDSLDAKSKWHNKPLSKTSNLNFQSPENMMPSYTYYSAMFRNKKTRENHISNIRLPFNDMSNPSTPGRLSFKRSIRKPWVPKV